LKGGWLSIGIDSWTSRKDAAPKQPGRLWAWPQGRSDLAPEGMPSARLGLVAGLRGDLIVMLLGKLGVGSFGRPAACVRGDRCVPAGTGGVQCSAELVGSLIGRRERA
jgi:hypothetical protein